MKKRTTFKEELRNSLIIHALTPCILFGVISFLIFIIGTYVMISYNNKKDINKYMIDFETAINYFLENNKIVKEKININEFKTDSKKRVIILDEVYKILNPTKNKASFFLFDDKFDIVYSNKKDSYYKNLLCEYLKLSKNKIFKKENDILYIYDSNTLENSKISSFIIYSNIIKNGKFDGMLAFVLDINKIKFRQARGNCKFLIVNKYNRILNSTYLGDNRNKLIKNIRDKEGICKYNSNFYYISSKISVGIDCKIYAISLLNNHITVIILLFFSLIIFIGIAVVLIKRSADKFSNENTKTIYDLKQAFFDVENGNMDFKISFDSNEEFNSIANSFNMMLSSIKSLIEKNEKISKENTVAIIHAIDSQFNPHFLFNTLESIRYMIKFEPELSQKMIVKLSRLLRYSINENKDLVRLEEEILFLNDYITLMKMRYSEKLDCFLDIDIDTEKLKIPRMILEPIVENSIKYGFSEEKEKLTILVKALILENELNIIINDDGKGIDKDILEEIKLNLSRSENHTAHIGLYNINKRIELLYGEQYKILLNSIKDYGTEIILRLPIEKED